MSTFTISLTLLLVLSFSLTDATKGMDISSSGFTKERMECYKDLGYTFLIVRAYECSGKPDPNAPASIANAWAAGFDHVDAYIFPCYHCAATKPPAAQVKEAVDYLKESGSEYGILWLDIEGTWGGEYESHQKFFEGLVDGCSQTDIKCGVYSNKYGWTKIMGSEYSGGSQLPLWYAHYDHTPSFDDFSAFAGWDEPNIKQYAGDQKEKCYTDYIDQNYYP